MIISCPAALRLAIPRRWRARGARGAGAVERARRLPCNAHWGPRDQVRLGGSCWRTMCHCDVFLAGRILDGERVVASPAGRTGG